MAIQAADLNSSSNPMLPVVAVIGRRHRETHDIYSLEVRPPAEASGFTFAPGQFNMVYLFGQGEVPVSISGDPGRRNTIVHTIRAVGPITSGLGRLKRGDSVGIRGPFGSAWPVDVAKGCDVIVVAGGVGLAPLRPAILHLLSNRRDYGTVSVLYGTRTPEDLLFARQLERWRGRFDLHVEVTVDTAGSGWGGDVGVVTTLIPRARFDSTRAVAFICGPEVMMRFTLRGLMARGISSDRLFLSMERNMKCAVGFCGHCQLGPTFICKDGPVFRYDRLAPWFGVREL
jgi:NAD(P)H-flavin reductase